MDPESTEAAGPMRVLYSLMGIALNPPTEAAGVHLRASRSEAERQLAAHGEPNTFQRGGEGNPSLVVRAAGGLHVFVYFDDADVVDAVELGRPEGGESVTFDGIDVFSAPAEDVIEQLSRRTSVKVEDGGRSATATQLLLALWRPTLPEYSGDAEGRYFESVLVARPGYYE